MFDKIILLLTGLVAAYITWRFYTRYSTQKSLYDIYYMMAFVVLLVSGLLLIFFGYAILASPYVLTVATLIPLGISMGLVEQFYPQWKKAYKWFAVVGFLAIAISAVGNMEMVKRISVPLFHGVAGLIIFIAPFMINKEKKGFWWVSIGGLLISTGGMALAFLKAGKQLLFFSEPVVFAILAPLLLLMAWAFTWGFMQDMDA